MASIWYAGKNYDRKFDKLDRLRQQVENGTLSLRLAATYPKEQASAAHKRLEADGTRDRLIIEFLNGSFETGSNPRSNPRLESFQCGHH
jgi:hypothetical protein